MARRWIWIGLTGFLVALLSVGLTSAQAAKPLQSQLTVSHLSPVQTTAGASLQFLKSRSLDESDLTSDNLQLAQAAPPRQVTALADPSNFGDRYATDINGRVLRNDFIAVLHETVGSAQSAINLFRTHHPRDQDQVSYHALIGRDGTIYYIVPPEKRAFGAGNSVFDGPSGPETVRTNSAFPPSVNNFAYHISLETPGDGMNNRRSHSGYTPNQYASLAWLLAQTTIPDSRITTHQAVDRSGNRMDPRSFNGQGFFALLRRYPTRSGLSG
ncbi:peptidoglycan recognition family protein [Nodosilinea sp. LEGE 07298]|uniref:peptidoglycan recognition protein family protein n=1 Tax=Nodosilinea sp. LEGE 07298 TaxID=2777970 RepID=UPI0028BE2DD1|nr:peptidoglycan recognition family protein [Nodosilinea sp. LEGE 07298]